MSYLLFLLSAYDATIEYTVHYGTWQVLQGSMESDILLDKYSLFFLERSLGKFRLRPIVAK